MDNQQLLQLINEVSIYQPSNDFVETLTAHINDLVQHNFDRLIYILYRVDIDEKGLKKALHDNPQTDAAIIITDLIIKRQQEKLKAKKQFKKDDSIPEEDKW